MLAVAVLLVALATVDVGAQEGPNYDILCSDNGNTVGNHVFDKFDCRIYYNCDNFGGGKRLQCGDGTLYNHEFGVCTDPTTCAPWENDNNNINNCRNNPSFTRKYGSVCCQTYFLLLCNKTILRQACPANQFFNEASQSCSTVKPGNCSDCTNMQYSPCNVLQSISDEEECHFTYKGFTNLKTQCPRGTRWDKVQCQCVHDTASRCSVTSEVTYPKGCGDKRAWNGAVFSPIPNTTPLASPTIYSKELWAMNGADIFHKPFALMLQFAATSSGIILTSQEPTACNKTKLKVEVSGSEVVVTISHGYIGTNLNSVKLSGRHNFGGEIKLLIVTGGTTILQVYLNNANTPMSVTEGQTNFLTNLKNTAGAGSILCLPILGTVGSPKLALWRECTDANKMLNNLP